MSEGVHIVCPYCRAVNRVPERRLVEGPKCGKCTRPLFNGAALPMDERLFERHIQRNDIAVLVDFWAPWCGPCKMMAPTFEKAAARIEPYARLAKVNTEEEQGLALRHNIRSIPTLALFQGGREIDRVAGAMEMEHLVGWVAQHLNRR